ncbi:hypothetical protein NIES4103_19450 [Nostoc sp. NIES-4103]|nr:hypothetical protein NIES4103_19450 [Nostoc sp. NIES-4103]
MFAVVPSCCCHFTPKADVSSMTFPSRPPSPKWRRNEKIRVLLPSPTRRGAGGEVKTALVELTPKAALTTQSKATSSTWSFPKWKKWRFGKQLPHELQITIKLLDIIKYIAIASSVRTSTDDKT